MQPVVGSCPLIHPNYFLPLAAGLWVCMNRVRYRVRDRDRFRVRAIVSTRLKINRVN